MSKHIFFISSYPKSGNTLMRIIISSLFFSDNGITDFNKLNFIQQLENTKILEFIKSHNINDFNKLNNIHNIYKYHVLMKEKLNLGFKEDFSFFKTHHVLSTYMNYKYVEERQIRGIIYIIRDPRDIVLSWQNHSGQNINNSVELVTNNNSTIGWELDVNSNFSFNSQPPVLISSWKNHINSWTLNNYKIPMLILKYEDLITEKELTLHKIINFFKLNYNIEILNLEEKIKNIIQSTDFKNLKEKEKKFGFNEKMNGNFFNKGKVGNWKNKLDRKYVDIIEKNFEKEMKKYKYL